MPTDRPSSRNLRKVRTGNRFFLFIVVATGILLLAAFLPFFLGASTFFEGDLFPRLIGFGVSFLVAAFLFGLIGDSTADVTGTGPLGLGIQLGGSAAGFVVFYLVITYGLSNFSSLGITVTSADGRLLADPQLKITVDQRPRQELSVVNGRADFAYLPRGQAVPIFLEPTIYEVTAVEPETCRQSAQLPPTIKPDCQSVTLRVARRQVGIDDFRDQVWDAENFEARLGAVLSTARGKVQQFLEPNARAQVVGLVYSDLAIEKQVAEARFPLNRRYGSPVSLCGMLSDVVTAYNAAHPQDRIVILVGAQSFSVHMLSEHPPHPGDEICYIA